MGQFPIAYTEEKPPAVGPSVRGQQIDVRTGEGQITRGWEQIGGALFDMGMKIRQTDIVIERSEIQRRYEQIMNAGLQTYSLEQDENIRGNIKQKAFADAQALIGSAKYPEVNTDFEAYFNNTIEDWNKVFVTKDLAIRDKILTDKMNVEGRYHLENGDLVSYAKLQYKLEALGKITPIMREENIKNFPINSTFERARIIMDTDPQTAIDMLEGLKKYKLSGEQLDQKDRLLRIAKQQAAWNTNLIQNEITFGMFENRDKTLAEKAVLGEQYINRLKTTSGLSAADARVMTNMVEKWMEGKPRTNDIILYSNLYNKVTKLKRGIGRAEEIRKEIVNAYPNLDDQHFEAINEYFAQKVESWSGDTLDRLEKEAKIHLAPSLSMLEKFMTMPVAEQIRNKNLIDRLQEPAKRDATRLALYNERCRKWSEANPDAPNLYEVGKGILAQFERYTDVQIEEMERRLEEIAIEKPKIPTPEELRRQNTPEAYQKGVELGYWE